MSDMSMNGRKSPLVISGYSSQSLAQGIADGLGSRIVAVTYKQFADKEIQTTIEENVRASDVLVVASASGDPNKQEKETRLLMRAVNRSGAKKVTLLLPYMWYGRSDDIWDERNAPGLVDTIENMRSLCQSVLIVDPHNAGLAREKFLDAGSSVRDCTIVHFSYPFAVQLQYLIEKNFIKKEGLLLAHADAGSTKRISRSFRACMYKVLGFEGRNANQDDWPQGLKDRDKATGKIKVRGFSSDVRGKDVVIFEDMISSGGTSCELASQLKAMKARSVVLFVSSGLFTTDPKKGNIAASVERVNNSDIDAMYITDTYNHSLTDPEIHEAIIRSPVIHVVETAPYLAAIIAALHLEPSSGEQNNDNSVSALLHGVHPEQSAPKRPLCKPVKMKEDAAFNKLLVS